MLYTSKPLERIFFNHNEEKKELTNKVEYKEISLDNGRVITKRMGDKYVVDYINSTDMLDYLNINYSPGKEI